VNERTEANSDIFVVEYFVVDIFHIYLSNPVRIAVHHAIALIGQIQCLTKNHL